MADDDDRNSDVKEQKKQNRSNDADFDKRTRDSDRHRRNRDNDRSRDDGSRNNRRRSRSRSGSRERTSASRSGREGSRNVDRRRSSYDDDDDDNATGRSRRGESSESEEGRFQGKKGRKDEDFHSGNERISGHDWRSKLTSIRDAHFNRSKQAPTLVQNQFKNDGSFLEMFKKKMAEQTAKGEEKTSLTPNSLVLASSSIQFSHDLSLPPLTTAPLDAAKPSSGGIDPDEDLDGVPMPSHKSLPVPVSVGKRRLAKPLKTGIVVKKPQETEEDEASQEKLDAWSSYLQEVQKYKSSNCVDEDNSRPLVK